MTTACTKSDFLGILRNKIKVKDMPDTSPNVPMLNSGLSRSMVKTMQHRIQYTAMIKDNTLFMRNKVSFL